MKIYTSTGDSDKTSLFSGDRLKKTVLWLSLMATWSSSVLFDFALITFLLV